MYRHQVGELNYVVKLILGFRWADRVAKLETGALNLLRSDLLITERVIWRNL